MLEMADKKLGQFICAVNALKLLSKQLWENKFS